MIYGELEHFRGAFCGCEAIRRAAAFLLDKAAASEDGRHQLGDGIYVDIKRYAPAPAAQRRYESHIRYADLQVVFEGSEIICYQPLLASMIEAVTEDRLEKSDVRFHAEPDAAPEIPLKLRPGLFALLMPADAHKTECFAGSAEARKAIAKIPVEMVKF